MACAARTCAGCAELSGTPGRAPLPLMGRVTGAGRCRAGVVGGTCGRVDSRGPWRSGYHSRGDGASGNLPAVAGQRVSTARHQYPIAPADLDRSTGVMTFKVQVVTRTESGEEVVRDVACVNRVKSLSLNL